MEDSGKALGGGAPTAAEQAEMEGHAEQVYKAAAAEIAGVQAAPDPRQLDEGDHMKYKLLGKCVENSELKIAMYQRELQHAQIERSRHVHELSVHVRHLEQKYATSLLNHTVTEDGYIIERPEALRY